MSNERHYMFGANTEMPYAAKIANGYELESNDRLMRIVVYKRTFFVSESNVQLDKIEAACLVKEDDGWVQCDGVTQANSEREIIERLSRNEGFTNAIREYEENCLFGNRGNASIPK